MIRNCRLWVAVLTGFVLAVTDASAAPAGEEAAAAAAAAADKPMVTDPTTGMQVTAPEYGGTLTYPYKLFGETTDPSITGHYAGRSTRSTRSFRRETGVLPGTSSALTLEATRFKPETQSLRPAGNGPISGTEDGVSALRKSTIATATPRAAMILPQAR